MTEPGNPIRFDQTPQTNIYMCRSCENHVLSGESNFFEDPYMGTIISEDPVNVEVVDEESDRLRSDERQVKNVTCNDCRISLGGFVVPANVYDDGDTTFIFFLEKLLFWNGNQLVYADTKQPVEDNSNHQETKSTDEFK